MSFNDSVDAAAAPVDVDELRRRLEFIAELTHDYHQRVAAQVRILLAEHPVAPAVVAEGVSIIDIGQGETLRREMKTTGAVGWLRYSGNVLVHSLNGTEIRLVESALRASHPAVGSPASKAASNPGCEPVAWGLLHIQDPELTNDEQLAAYWERKGRKVTPLYAAPSTRDPG